MTQSESEVDRIMAERSSALHLAAARLAGSVGALMERAVARSGRLAREVADEMMVSEGRISQLLSADGNIKVSTLARFMDACGYEVVITAVPKDSSVPSLETTSRARQRDPIQTEFDDMFGHDPVMSAGVGAVARRDKFPDHLIDGVYFTTSHYKAVYDIDATIAVKLSALMKCAFSAPDQYEQTSLYGGSHPMVK